MTDLISNITEITPEKLQEIYIKFAPTLEIYSKLNSHIPYLAVLFKIGTKHLIENHSELNSDWKTWAMVVLKYKYFDDNIKSGDDIIKTIDDFVIYWKANYKTYCDDIAIFSNEQDRDSGFVNSYIKNR